MVRNNNKEIRKA